MDAMGMLREAISSLPIPAAPPRMSLDGAAVGLGFLDAALRLNHVRRLTERLTFSEHRRAQRTTQVDVSISMLTDIQLEAASGFQALAGHTFPGPDTGRLPESPLWVPVALLPRANLGALEVYGESGHRLPRITEYETSRLVASGLYRLLRGILASRSDADETGSGLGSILHQVSEPRWLIQSAILTVLTEGSGPPVSAREDSAPAVAARGQQDSYRAMALAVLGEHEDILADYLQLLEVAAGDRMIVVALDSASDEHLLTYQSPLHVTGHASWSARTWHLLRAGRWGYFARYETAIPTTLRSYHLVAEAVPGVAVDRLFLSTDADENDTNSLVGNLDAVAGRLERGRGASEGPGRSRAIEHELGVLVRQLSELARRRRWEAGAAGVRDPSRSLPSCQGLIRAGEEAEASQARGGEPGRSLLAHPFVTAQHLRAAAKEISGRELRRDIVAETGPRAREAHVHWRRPPSGVVSSRQTSIKAGVVLRNMAESTISMVMVYALAVASITYAVACFIGGTPWPLTAPAQPYADPHNPEAIIGILLLVPGFLYTRLALPERGTVANRLRTVPRLVSYACIVAMVGVSAAVAGRAPGSVTRLAFLLGTALPIAAAVPLLFGPFGPRRQDPATALARLGAPRWATNQQRRKARTADVTFTSSIRTAAGPSRKRAPKGTPWRSVMAPPPAPARPAAPARGPAGPGQGASSRELADLARAGFLMLRQPKMQVIYEVHHVADRPGYLFDRINRNGHQQPQSGRRAGSPARAPATAAKDGPATTGTGQPGSADTFGETLTSSANGLGLVVVTRSGLGTGSRSHHNLGRRQCTATDTEQSRVFRGTARPNPSFIYESAWRFEALIGVDTGTLRVREWHAAAMRDIVTRIARIAHDVQAPIMSLQAPAQVPVDHGAPSPAAAAAGDEEGEESSLPRAASLAVRFAIAIGKPDTETLLGVTTLLRHYCDAHGFGLWLADTRIGSRQGNWFQVLPPDAARAAGRFRGSGGTDLVTAFLPVTMVGPARRGSTLSLMSLLNEYREIGIAACSVISLDDLLFINMQLTFSEAGPAKVLAVRDRVEAEAASALRPAEALSAVLAGKLGLQSAVSGDLDQEMVKLTADYQCLIGPSRALEPGDSPERMAVWFSWQVQGSRLDLALPLHGLAGAFADLGLVPDAEQGGTWGPEAPNIEYLVCRNIGNSVLRGRGKLTIPRDTTLRRYPGGGAESRPTILCVSLEEAWRGQTAHSGNHTVRDLTVAWRECWLGHWSLPL